MKITEDSIHEVVLAIRNNSEFNFEDYSQSSLKRRVAKILYDFDLDIDTIVAKINEDSYFCKQVAHSLLVETTDFFRNPAVWQELKHKILNKFEDEEEINIWHAGCSTGQEVYSMIIILNELELLDRVNILATDINRYSLEHARLGEYSYKYHNDYFKNFDEVIRKNPFYEEMYNEVPYSRYFEINKIAKTVQIHEQFREKPAWVKHDLVNWSDIFENKFHIIMCRNVLIYFNIIVQSDILEKFHQNLLNDGVLVLGAEEDIMSRLKNNFEKRELLYIKKF